MSNVRDGKKIKIRKRKRKDFGVPLYERIGKKPDIGLKGIRDL